jgi:hypothetical protein
MTHHQSAQGLASLGRRGDSMLVHMSPHEVAGLNYLAQKQGTKLTVNPHTGLPEAFSLGGFFSSFLPTIAGMAFAPETGGFSMAPLLAGAATGAGLAAIKKEDPLMGALMGGLGGYGGGQLGPALSNAAGAGTIAPDVLNKGMQQVVAGGADIANPLVKDSITQTVSSSLGISPAEAANMVKYGPLTAEQGTILSNVGQYGPLTGGSSGVAGTGFMDKLSQAGTGLKNIATGQPGAWDAFKAAGGTGTQLALPVGGAVLSGLEPSDLYGEPLKTNDKGKYNPYSTLNLGNDTGLRLYAGGGAIGNPSVGQGISDLYNRPEGQTNEILSRDGYGIGRLDNLAAQQSLDQAKTMGYAMGGPVSFADGGDAMKLSDEIPAIDQGMGLGSLAPVTSQSMPTQQVQNAAISGAQAQPSDSGIIAQVATKLKTDPNYQPTNPIEVAIAKQLKGDSGQQGQGLGSLGSAQPSQPMVPSYNASQPIGPTYYAGMNAPRSYAQGGLTTEGYNYNNLPTLNLNTGLSTLPGAMGGNRFKKGPPVLQTPHPVKKYNMGMMAKGGYLDGAGDGMSDSIPATIEGKQPARLADGEFVVPADVVSHLGNGSSKAGSQRLYAMLDKVRKARTGHTKQGKQINPNKYLPA